jgi:Isocitrate/isopropylmalate dehydrogenase
MTKKIEAALIPGDGIGPEITKATLTVLDALGAPFEWTECSAGMTAFEATGNPLPEETVAVIGRTRLALKGPLATPPGGGYRSATVQMRERFKLFANVRPGKTIIPGRYDGVDILLVRENLEGLYVGREHYIEVGGDPHGVGVGIGINTKEGMKRCLRYTFDLAVSLGRKRVTVVHKANVLKVLTGVFLEAAKELAPEYEGRLQVDDMIVDACAMNLVLRPERFDVIVTTNLFGDILSDLVAGLVGGLGLVPGANIGADVAIFEAVHGTAPDIAGKGIANPTALLMASAMMLDHVGEAEKADRLRAAISKTLLLGQRTGDLGGTLDTMQYAEALAANL